MKPAALVDLQHDVAVVRLNRPESRNAFGDLDMIDEVVETLRSLDRDREARCIVLTGEGSAFCAGGDLRKMKDGSALVDPERPERTRAIYRRGIQQLPELFEALETPVIAAVNGPAMGAGCDLAMMCDIRIASTRAVFAQTFVKLGLVSGDGGAWLLSRTLGFADACELALTGDPINAERALAIGLISKVTAPEDLLEDACALARRISANPIDGVRMTKRLLRMGRHTQMAQILEVSAAMQALAHHTAAHREALDEALSRMSSPRTSTGA